MFQRASWHNPLHGRVATLVVLLQLVAGGAAAQDDDILGFDLEQLTRLSVSSASRKPQERSSTAAATYVLTGEDIRRSGYRNLPEVLSLAPGVQVGRITSNQWAVGVRGFASRLARSTLVLMDGRSVYTPLFAGTYWEAQDTLLDDVSQIEVIRGPGGAVWGANAFNGVINILTKHARDTQGGLLEIGGGNEEEGFAGIRYGGRLGDDAFYRIYGKAFSRDGGFLADAPAYDDWQMGRAGFRIDWEPSRTDVARLQGDLYEGSVGQSLAITTYDPPASRRVVDDARLAGGNVLGSWQRYFPDGSDLEVQSYFDVAHRDEANLRQHRYSWDVEAKHHVVFFDRHDVQWGGGYRVNADRTDGVESVEFLPDDRANHLLSFFLQDEVLIVPDRFHATLGARLEHNDYSGWEISPSVRALWRPEVIDAVWASVSRAVRTPSRVERDLRLDGFSDALGLVRIIGDGGFDPEKVVSYEAGARWRPIDPVALDVAVFYNDFEDLLSIEPGTPFEEERGGETRRFLPFFIRNGLSGESYGAEVAVDTHVLPGWRVRATYSWLAIHLDRDPGSADISGQGAEHMSPQNQLALRSMLDLPERFQLDGVLRWVDRLEQPHVESYFDLTLRLARRFEQGFELAVVGQDLVESRHVEFAGGTEVERSVYGSVRCWW